jgi:O-succinylhomoserine sulfhydrylase
MTMKSTPASASARARSTGARIGPTATPTTRRADALCGDVLVFQPCKHIDGQGRALGGVICGTRAHVRTVIEPYMKHTGGAMSPFTAWMMLNGLATLDLRVRAMTEAAARIAAALKGHPRVTRVIYPHDDGHPQAALARRQMEAGGTMVTIRRPRSASPPASCGCRWGSNTPTT